MVAFAMIEEDSAAILRDAMERFPPPNGYFPMLFGCFCFLHGMYEERDIEEYADKCGLTVMVKVVKLPTEAAESE